MSSLRIENVVKKFGAVTAVDNVSLDIPDGKFVILVGPSGCGKTTLLRQLAGLEAATSGKIYIGEKDVTNLHPRERDIAMVFQSYALYPHMTVRRNMEFALTLQKVPRPEIDSRVNAASEMLGIAGLLERQPKQLSGGQRQRVAVGRAIVRNPKVFLFDEPLSNLDAKMRNSMRGELIKLHKRLGSTIVYVTHDQVEAMTMGQIVVVMNGGAVQQVGAPMDIYRNPRNMFVAGFVGSPAMNFVPGKVDLATGIVEAGDGSLRYELEEAVLEEAKRESAGDVIIGFRPEHLQPVAATGQGDNAIYLDGTVDLVEPLGIETVIHVSCFDRSFVSRHMGETELRMGDRTQLALQPTKCLLFDARTEKRLGFM